MDKLYRVVIIDDDEFSADNLCLELKKYNRLSIDGMARNGANGRKLLEKVHPDLLFLDVELPDMKGMELLEQLRGAITWNMQIVFYTAYDKYMIYAIRGAAFDYLLKPIDKKELEGIIDRFMKKAEESAAASLVIPPRVYSAGEHTFMISTPINDLRILRSIDIGFFRYNSDRKLWENSKYRGNSMFGGWDAALVNQDYEINWLISPQYEGVTKRFTEKFLPNSFQSDVPQKSYPDKNELTIMIF